MGSKMGDLKDEETGLLSEEGGSVVEAPSEDALRKTTIWSVGMTLLIFMGLLGVIITIYHVENLTQVWTFMARRDSLKTLKAPVNVLVVGDWGRKGAYNQTLVANQDYKTSGFLYVVQHSVVCTANHKNSKPWFSAVPFGWKDNKLFEPIGFLYGRYYWLKYNNVVMLLTRGWVKIVPRTRAGQPQMAKVGKQLDVNFIISTGDNFYDLGLKDVHDDLFTKSFSEIYQAPSLQTMWYAVLGNHDYRGNPEAQVDNYLTSRDSRWFCDYTYTLSVDLGLYCNGGMDMSSSVDFFFIDTNPFEEDYWTPNSEHYKWTRSTSRQVVIANTLKNLTEALEASTATWKLVVGHHTMFSYGAHGNTPELVEKILPILKANNVELYINGHDHSLQHIKRSDSDIHFVTSGAGSKAWKGEFASYRPDAQLYYDGQGFTSISITSTALLVNYYDITGTIIHQIELKK